MNNGKLFRGGQNQYVSAIQAVGGIIQAIPHFRTSLTKTCLKID